MNIPSSMWWLGDEARIDIFGPPDLTYHADEVGAVADGITGIVVQPVNPSKDFTTELAQRSLVKHSR